MGEAMLWVVLAMGAVATYLPRLLGVVLSGRIDADGAVFRWVGCIGYGLLSGLIARMILLPVGPLQETDLSNRMAAAALALSVYFLTRRGILAGVATGVLALIGLTMGDVRIL